MEFNASFIQTYENLILHKICMNVWNLISLWCTLGTYKQISKKKCHFSNKNETLQFLNMWTWIALNTCNNFKGKFGWSCYGLVQKWIPRIRSIIYNCNAHHLCWSNLYLTYRSIHNSISNISSISSISNHQHLHWWKLQDVNHP
jgi:hypothetical protein